MRKNVGTAALGCPAAQVYRAAAPSLNPLSFRPTRSERGEFHESFWLGYDFEHYAGVMGPALTGDAVDIIRLIQQ